LQCSGGPIKFAYFPVSGMVTLAWILEDGHEVTTLGIGREGAINATPGISLSHAAYHVKAQLSACLLRLPAECWQQVPERNQHARRLLSRYGECLFARTQQALACTTKHDVESRFCQWLLKLHEWQAGEPLAITHQTLSNLVGVRRTTITLMARSLQEAGIIAYRRGVIEVIDLYALKQASCECYRLGQAWYES
jgi:CRP-like cAMP-binding protein